ncbi:MAG: SdpI family protein [Candidatus Diapherotrites archaeon]|nr:SdpI family protein [Candidatus Diapherotrites archaeon]
MLNIDNFWLLIFLILVSFFVLSAYFFPYLPDKMPIHWNIKGEVDGYMQKEFALMIMPLSSFIIVLLLAYLPKIDPLKENYSFFMPYFKGFVIVIILFFLYIHIILLSFGLGYKININQLLLMALSLLFIYLSFLLKKSKRNWFIGIRTPWTLSSDTVWEKTHRLGSFLFLFQGAILLFAAIFANMAPEIILASVFSIIISIALLFIYSYFLYSKEQKLKTCP